MADSDLVGSAPSLCPLFSPTSVSMCQRVSALPQGNRGDSNHHSIHLPLSPISKGWTFFQGVVCPRGGGLGVRFMWGYVWGDSDPRLHVTAEVWGGWGICLKRSMREGWTDGQTHAHTLPSIYEYIYIYVSIHVFMALNG